jgi:hypothetical protein
MAASSSGLYPQKKNRRLSRRIFIGAGNVTRTRDLRITNALLYQLSYSSDVDYYSSFLEIRQVLFEKKWIFF